jgi:hypothetical protein
MKKVPKEQSVTGAVKERSVCEITINFKNAFFKYDKVMYGLHLFTQVQFKKSKQQHVYRGSASIKNPDSHQ